MRHPTKRVLAVVSSIVALGTAGALTANAISTEPTTATATFTVTYTIPTVTETTTVTEPTPTEPAPTTTETTPSPPPVPHVEVPKPLIPPGAITVTPATIAAQFSSAPLGSTLVADPGVYPGDYTLTRQVHLVGRAGSVFTGHFRIQAAGVKLFGGFEIDGSGRMVDNACVWIDGRTDVLVEKTEIHGCFADGIFAGSGSHRTTIRDNWIHHNGRVVTNTVPQRHGVYFSGGVDSVMTNNVIEDNQGNGFQIKGTTTRLNLSNNTILRNGSKEWGEHQGANGVILDSSGVSNSTVQANIIAFNTETGIRKLATTGTNNRLVGNASWQNARGICPLASTFSSASNFTFFCAGLVDGGGNLELEPLTDHAYGSSLYVY